MCIRDRHCPSPQINLPSILTISVKTCYHTMYRTNYKYNGSVSITCESRYALPFERLLYYDQPLRACNMLSSLLILLATKLGCFHKQMHSLTLISMYHVFILKFWPSPMSDTSIHVTKQHLSPCQPIMYICPQL